jgi:acyl dehydratase
MFEDFKVGEKYISPSRTVTETDVVLFAGLSGDYNPLHVDEEFAKKSIFGGRIAHGILTLAISAGLGDRCGWFDGTAIAFLGFEEVRFTAPVKLGDTITVEVEIVDKRESRKKDRGIVVQKRTVRNQRGEIVMEARFVHLVKRSSQS